MDAQQLLSFLGSLGVNTSGITPDNLASCLSETIVIKKFDGDDTTGTPIETITIRDGKVVENQMENQNGTN